MKLKFNSYRICVTVSALLTNYREMYGNNTFIIPTLQKQIARVCIDRP